MARQETALEIRSIPRIWPDSTIIVIGGGPSVAKVDMDLLFNPKFRTIGVNHSFLLGPVDLLWFGDFSWYQANQEAVHDFAGLKCTCATQLPEKPWPDIKRVRRCAVAKGESREGLFGIEASAPDRVRWNHNSGASAINVAYHLGASRVVLVGFDMRRIKGKSHYHDHYPEHDNVKDRYEKHLRCFDQIAADAKVLGLEILNCTPGSVIKQFPFVKLGDV